ncbi:MAG: uncharacterized protein PWP48_235 [Clostridiales bacterium]|jgi:hypothetical protein|nr:uncharacterized protein [Clostridiales bacterium]MDK2991002.1 uncharacterized protein [Clostridiales bacterium]
MPYLYGFDTGFLLFFIPAMILAMYAQFKVQNTFAKYLKVPNRKGYTGVEVARYILDANGLNDVRIERIPGALTDHYDPSKRVLRLSEPVYSKSSIASISVAAHESGHAIQHQQGYFPLIARNALVPVVNFSAQFTWILIILGLIMSSGSLINAGIILFSAAVLFQIITLPVEFNASHRALAMLSQSGIISDDERPKSRAVLSAAALTYVAAAAVSIAQLLRLLLIRGNRD